MKELLTLIERATTLGLNEEDVSTSRSFIENHEYGLCFDTIITQMYEYNITIDSEFYRLIVKIGDSMNLSPETYSFMMELIKKEQKN